MKMVPRLILPLGQPDRLAGLEHSSAMLQRVAARTPPCARGSLPSTSPPLVSPAALHRPVSSLAPTAPTRARARPLATSRAARLLVPWSLQPSTRSRPPPSLVARHDRPLVHWVAARSASTNAGPSSSPPGSPQQDVVYAHEDLLLPSSTAPSRRSDPPRSSSPRAKGNPKAQPYFSPSYLLADEPPLPPPSTSPLVPLSSPIPAPLPPSVLSTGLPNPQVRWRAHPQTSIADDVTLYKQLGKFKLSSLVVLTTMAGYAICPVDPATATAAMDALAVSLGDTSGVVPSALAGGSVVANSLTLSVLLPATVGTTLCAFSAAAFNQLIEAPYDAQMARTRARPLPKRVVTPLHAATYGVLTGSVGLATLYAINPLSAFLGLFTIVLYCPLYTISKRHSVYNTWLGALVGALPPLIGWAACTNSVDPLTQPGAWALPALLFAWQFPHFMSLAHTLRSSYASSGYRMLAVLDPRKNALVSLRYALAILPLCAAYPALGLTNAAFVWLSLAPNGLLAVTAWRFWRRREERRAKELFWASLVRLSLYISISLSSPPPPPLNLSSRPLRARARTDPPRLPRTPPPPLSSFLARFASQIHLPVVLALAMVCKKGLWGEDVDESEQEGDEQVLAESAAAAAVASARTEQGAVERV